MAGGRAACAMLPSADQTYTIASADLQMGTQQLSDRGAVHTAATPLTCHLQCPFPAHLLESPSGARPASPAHTAADPERLLLSSCDMRSRAHDACSPAVTRLCDAHTRIPSGAAWSRSWPDDAVDQSTGPTSQAAEAYAGVDSSMRGSISLAWVQPLAVQAQFAPPQTPEEPAPTPDDPPRTPAPPGSSPAPDAPYAVPRTPPVPPPPMPGLDDDPFPAEPAPIDPKRPAPQRLVQPVSARALPSPTLDLALAHLGVGASSDESSTPALPGPSAPPVSASPLPADFQYPPLPVLAPLQYRVATLDNGLRVYMVEEHNAPFVAGSLIFPGGQYSSPVGKEGLASIATAVQRAGGTSTLSSAQLNDTLEVIAADIESSANAQASSLSFSCLAQDADQVMDVVSDVLQHASIPEDKIALYKAQSNNLVAHENDSKAAVASRKARELLHGKASLYARRTTLESVATITREDIIGWLERWQRPDQARLILIGDLSADEMLHLASTHYSGWQVAPGQPKQAPQLPREDFPTGAPEGRLFVVDVPGLQQASVAIAEPGISLADPDLFALDVLSSLLNGFGGKLFDSVRSESGLAYSVSAGWESPVDHQGLFMASGDTARPADLIRRVRQVFDGLRESPLPAEEVQREKDKRANQFVFKFASKGEQAQRAVIYNIVGLPEDFLFKYQQGIKEVTSASLYEAALRHLHPDKQIVVVVCDAKSAMPQLESLNMPIEALRL